MVPTVRVIITFTKFVELQRPEEQFFTPVSSPRQFIDFGRNNGYDVVVSDVDDDNNKKGNHRSSVSTSWLSRNGSRSGLPTLQKGSPQQVVDPFVVPVGYAWSSFDEKGKQLKKSKSTSRKIK